MAEGFDIAQTGRIRRIGIARPETGNTMTDPMLEHLADSVAEAGRDESVHAVLLSGAGPDFCLGRERGGGPPPATAFDAHRDVFSKILAVYAAFRACPVPVVARVRGRALGFGCALVGGADIATVKRFLATGPGLPPDIAADLAGYTMATVKSRR